MHIKTKLLIISFAFILLSGTSYAQSISQWFPRGVEGGMYSPSINPANNNEYYIVCDIGELFHTADFGQSYTQMNYSQFVGGHYSKMCYTSTANLLYSINYNGSAHRATTVRSADNGATWSPLTGNANLNADVWTMYVDYANPNRIIISSHNNIYFSNDVGAVNTSIHTCNNSTTGNIVGGVFFDSQNIYIGTNEGLLVSTTGGTSWNTTAISGIPSTEAFFLPEQR